MNIDLLDADVVREALDYDPDTGILRWKRIDVVRGLTPRQTKNWNDRHAGAVAGNAGSRAGGYSRLSIQGVNVYAHVVAWAHGYGRAPLMPVVHINSVWHDNRLCNLREATPTEHRNYLDSRARREAKRRAKAEAAREPTSRGRRGAVAAP